MRTLKITEIRQVAKENEWPDSWWHSIDGVVSDTPTKIGKTPRQNTVFVKNEKDTGSDWIRFRYPGYITPEELEEQRLRNLPTEKQKVAIEFFGRDSSNITRQDASDLLDRLFSSKHSWHDYNEFKWIHRHRIYNAEELLEKSIHRHQNNTLILNERIAESRIKEAVSRAIEMSISEDDFLDFLKVHYSNFFISEKSTRRKKKEHNEYLEFQRELQKPEKKQGCMSCILFSIIGVASLIVLNWI